MVHESRLLQASGSFSFSPFSESVFCPAAGGQFNAQTVPMLLLLPSIASLNVATGLQILQALRQPTLCVKSSVGGTKSSLISPVSTFLSPPVK